MSKILELCGEQKCTHDITLPSDAFLLSVKFRKLSSRYLAAFNLPAQQLVRLLCTEVFDMHTGKIYDNNGEELDYRGNPDLTDDIFGQDERRTMSRMIEFAHREPKYLTPKNMLPLMKFIYCAMEIRLCRKMGPCSDQVCGSTKSA